MVYNFCMSKTNTRQRLLDRGRELLLSRGYADTGVQELLIQAGLPKGSFYYHFPSKRDFALQVLDQYASGVYQALEQHLGSPTLPTTERIRRFFAEQCQAFEEKGCRFGCLLGNLGQEMAAVDEGFRLVVALNLQRWVDRIAGCLQDAQSNGELDPECDAEDLANMLVNGFQGAVLRMKLDKNSHPLTLFLHRHFDLLLRPGKTPVQDSN